MEAFPIAIHNKIRRQKVTIAMATECRMGALQRAGRALQEMQGSVSLHPPGCHTQISSSSPIHPHLHRILIVDHSLLASTA